MPFIPCASVYVNFGWRIMRAHGHESISVCMCEPYGNIPVGNCRDLSIKLFFYHLPCAISLIIIHDDVSAIPPLMPSLETSRQSCFYIETPVPFRKTGCRTQFWPSIKKIRTHSKCSTESTVNFCSIILGCAISAEKNHAHVVDEAPTSLLRTTTRVWVESVRPSNWQNSILPFQDLVCLWRTSLSVTSLTNMYQVPPELFRQKQVMPDINAQNPLIA